MASGVSDGALIVDTKMDNSDFMSKAKKFTNALNNLKQMAVKIGQAMGSAGNAYLKSVSEQEKAVRNLGNDYKQLQARVVELNREINRMQREGVNDGNRQAFNALNAELEQTVARMNEVRRAGGEVKSVSGGFRSIVISAGQAARTLAGMAGGGAFKFLQKLASGAKNAAVQLAKLAARAAASSIKRLGSLFAGAAKSAWGFFRNLKKGNSGGGGLQVSLKNLLRYGLGIRSLFVLFNRLRSAIKEGFGALAQQNPEVQASLSALSAALNGLKGALASAFAPILTAVTPALVTLINLVTQAANAVGMLMAALTGKGFYSAAKGVASVGKAAGGAAGGVKKLNRELAGFDELTILKDNQSGGGGGGGGGGAGKQMFESVPVDSGIAEFITHIKELFGAGEYEAIGQIIGEGINKAFAKARDLISWENVSVKVEGFVDAVTGIFNGLIDGIEWPNIGATFGAGIDTLVQTAQRLLTGIEWADLGRGLGDGLNGLFAGIDWPTVGATIAEALGAQLTVVGNMLATFDLGEAARNAGEAFQAFATTLSARIRRIPWTTIGKNFANGVNSLFTLKNFMAAKRLLATALKSVFSAISEAVKGIQWSQIGSDLGTALSDFINNDIDWNTVSDTFTAAVKGIFEFGSGFLESFEADKAAENLKAALKKVPWGEIADAAWEFLSLALKKAGDFITVLFGGDVTEDAKDAVEAVEQMWDRHDGKKSSVNVGGSAEMGTGIGEAIGKALSVAISDLLTGFTTVIGSIPWDKIGTEIHDAIANINWIDVGTKINYAFKAGASGFKELALTTLFGENYLENDFVSTFLHQETADYLRDMVDQDIIPNFDVAGNALQEYIDKAVELGEPKYIDALLANLPAAFADSRDAIEQALRAAQIKSEGGTVAEAEAAAAFEKTLAESGETEAIKNLNQAYENGQVQTTEYINVAKRFGLDTGNVEQSYEDMLQTVFAKAVEIIEGADGQISISDAIGRAEANLSTTPFLKPEDITYLEEALTLAAQTQGWDLGAALGDGTVEGLNDEVKAKESEIENAFVQAYGYAKRINEVNSPSELYYRLGMEDVKGFVNAFKTLPKALAGVWEKLPEWARTLLGDAHGQFGVNLTGDSDGQRMQRQTNKELKQNTKALKKLKGKKTLLGLDTSGLNELAEGTDVKVGVNFVPGSDKATDSDKDGGDKDKNANSGLLGWLQQIFNPGVGVDVAVSLIRNGWNSIGEFIGTFLMVLLGLGKSGWDSLGGFIGTFLTVLLGLGKSGWTSLGGFIGTFLTVLLGLGKSGWTTLGGFVGTFLTVLLGLGKSGWTTITEFFGLKPGNIIETFINLFKGDKWNPEANAAMTTGDKNVTTKRNLINGTIDDTANKAMTTGDLVRETVRNLVDGAVGFWASAALSVGDTTTTTTRNLKDGILGFWASAALSVGDTTTTTTRNLKDGAVGFWAGAALSIGDTWTTTTRNLKDGVTDWFAKLAISAEDKTTTTTENLAKGNKWSSDAEAGVKAGNKTVTTTVNLVAGKISEFASKIAEGIQKALGNIKQWLGVATGGAISAGGHLTRFAAGGAVSKAGALRWWNHVPKYAGGTSRAHGTMFVAGEAGPEIVGHINGKTEILNKSQLASTMYAAVQGGMLAALKGIQFHMPVMATGSVTPYAVASEAAQRDRELQDTMNNNNEDLIQAMVSAIGNAANAIITAVQAQGGNNHIAGLTSRQVLDEFNRAAMMYAASPLKGV